MTQADPDTSSSDKCPTCLVDDTPASKDAFGPHATLANAIAGLVTTEDGGKSIALEGRWGSGKSTVVRLLVQRLLSQPHILVIVFDAWAHQGDPLRRTFLESLISPLRDKGWVDEEFLSEKENELSKRHKTTDRTTTPRLTSLGGWLAGFAVLIPVGLMLLNSALADRLTCTWSGWANVSLKAIIGSAFALNPLIICGLHYLRWRVRKWLGRTEKSWEGEGGLAVLAHRHCIEEHTTTTESPDPTSVEFGRTFAALMRRALDGTCHRIVLVLDHLAQGELVNVDDLLR